MEKYRFYLFGKEFTWICDCSSLSQFFESAELPTHQAQRWKLFMLRFDFTIVHRPDRMMRDVDMLSRYNNWSVDFKKQATDEATDPEATSHDQDDPQAKS